MFATHFQELTHLESEVSSIGNLHTAVACDESGDSAKGIHLLYEVRSGISTQSYGTHVAKAADLPPDLVRVSLTA